MKNNLVSRTINCIVKYFKITKKGKNEKAEEGKRQLKRMGNRTMEEAIAIEQLMVLCCQFVF